MHDMDGADVVQKDADVSQVGSPPAGQLWV